MRKIKATLRWLIGTFIAVYLLLAMTLNTPIVQRWAAQDIAHILQNKIGTKVEIGRVDLGLSGRIIVDDLYAEDEAGIPFLKVTRAAVRINLWDLLQKRIRIGNVQLFGLTASLYQEEPGKKANYQFLIDAFSNKEKKDKKKKRLDVKVGQILIRRASVTWDRRWKTNTPGRFNTNHLALENLNVTAQLNILKNDTLNMALKRLDVCEKTGLCIRELRFNLAANDSQLFLDDFHLALPHSEMDIDHLQTAYNLEEKTFNDAQLHLVGKVSAQDLIPILPVAEQIDNSIAFNTTLSGNLNRIRVEYLSVHDTRGLISLDGNGTLYQLGKGLKASTIEADITDLFVDTQVAQPFISNKMLTQLGTMDVKGKARWNQEQIQGDLAISTRLGNVSFSGDGTTTGNVNAHITSDGFNVGDLLADNNAVPVGNVALDIKVTGKLIDDLTVSGTIPHLAFKDYTYNGIALNGTFQKGKLYRGELSVADPNLLCEADGYIDLQAHKVELKAYMQQISPNNLRLTQKYADTYFSGKVDVSLQGNPWDNMAGTIDIDDLAMTTPEDIYRPGDIHIISRPTENERHLMFISPFLEAQVDGQFTPKTLVSDIMHIARSYLPTLIDEKENASQHTAYADFKINLFNAEPLRRIAGINIDLSQPLYVKGSFDADTKSLSLDAKASEMGYGSEKLKNIDLRLESNQQALTSTLQLQRKMKNSYVDVGIDLFAQDEKLTSRLYWNKSVEPIMAGDITLVSKVWKDAPGQRNVSSDILPSNILIGDSLWNVYPGSFTYKDGVLEVDSFGIGMGDRYLYVNGRASKEKKDVLHATLHQMKLEYLFSLINFHAVELGGEATGNIYAHSLFSKPYADAYLQIPDFTLNGGVLGDLDIYGNWGKRDYSIYLDGVISDPKQLGRTLVQGNITPKKNVSYHGLDLNVQAERLNLYFLNKFTEEVFDDLEGRASGWARIYGPFKQLNIEGDILVNEGSLGIPYLGVRYRLLNDSVTLRPNNIYFTNAVVYDPMGKPGVTGHQGKVSGHLTHNNFKNLCYDIDITGENILAYDFHDFGEESYYGTIFADGQVNLKGSPNNIDINVKAKPLNGTSLIYNATSPDKVTQGKFITYIDRAIKQDTVLYEATLPKAKSHSEIRINFDIDIDNNSTMKLLTDARSGDMITLYGSGHMLAKYYNKGSFDIFGTYRVEKGTYRLSLQEIIHKNFDFQQGGTIQFTGDPMNADLDLQAIHTVTGVSLNDLSARATFSNTSARVNCLMNVSGKARKPHIAFDFDILNVNEDEKQMVRSLISTEEERNMQVVYLLGIGRFYTYDYSNDNQSQGYTAMNSLLSSTLSGQINQMLTNMIGRSNWNFGANLSTGETGWTDLDVEGMLQGSLLNNRLLLNGNFGYRDNPVTSTNFIGDFDAQYHLTKSGAVSLKAYSETNDRYFTKSSLTTQGIGLLLKKDFSSWKDLFKRK